MPIYKTTVAPSQPVTLWKKRKKTADWIFKAAARGAGWKINPNIDSTETTEAEYDAAIAAVGNLRIG